MWFTGVKVMVCWGEYVVYWGEYVVTGVNIDGLLE